MNALDDGGTGVIVIVGEGPETLAVYTDNRPGTPMPIGGDEPPFPARHVWLHGYPFLPGSRRLPFGSPAESAVVDLLRLQVASLMTAVEESALVRGERRAGHPKQGDPAYHLRVWYSRLGPRELDVFHLRDEIDRIQWRRAHPVADSVDAVADSIRARSMFRAPS